MKRRSFLINSLALAISGVIPTIVPAKQVMGFKMIPVDLPTLVGELTLEAAPMGKVLADNAYQRIVDHHYEVNLVGDEGIRQLVQDTIGELVDADEILIQPESAQAAVIRDGQLQKAQMKKGRETE